MKVQREGDHHQRKRNFADGRDAEVPLRSIGTS